VAARDRDAFMAHWAGLLADASITKRVIVADGEVAGHVVVFDRDGRRELGYWLGRRHWGRGLASAAVGEVLQIERARPLWAGVVRDNAASLRVLVKHGFQEVGETAFADPFTAAPLPGVLLRLDA